MAVRIADSLKQQNDLTSFPVAYGSDLWLDKNKGSGTPNYASIQTLYNNGELGGGATEVTTMPTASEDYLGRILHYVGESGTYQKGHFYECILAHNGGTTYAWEDVDHLRFNHVVYHCTVPPVNEEYKSGDIIYYSGKTMGDFKNGYYYRAIPNATPQQYYGATFWMTQSSGTGYLCYTPFELRIGFIVYPTGTGGTSYPYEITDFDDTGITITPYDWSGEALHYVGVSYTQTVEGWEELEGGGGGSSIFYGTMEEWNALSADEKKQYEYMTDEQVGGGEILPYGVDATLRPKIQFYGVTASTGTGSFKRLKLSDNISILICPNVGTVTGTPSSGEARCTFFFPKTSGKKYDLISFSAKQSVTATAYLGYSEFVEESNDWRVDFYMYDCSANNVIYCTATVLEYTV